MLVLAMAFAMPALPAEGDDPFFDLDLKEVLNLEITSVSKKPQTVSQAAAAVFVITADDIRRSGATSIPELLRLAPGIQVAQISSSVWAVSARGMDARSTDKLLVLLDGRSVYTPTFSGVYWDVQDTVLADIERIEVIRGPGASLWGANAVNGVINIITKAAAATQGGMATFIAGDEEKANASVRYGGKLGEIGHWRVYAKGFERDGAVIESGGTPGDDDWRQQRVGFRSDITVGSHDSITVQGDYYNGRSGESSVFGSLGSPYSIRLATMQRVSGWNLLGRWQREVSGTDSFTLQGYADHTFRDWPGHLVETRNTYDLDFQYRTRGLQRHDIVAGASYRLSRDWTGISTSGLPAGTLPITSFDPASADRTLLSAFVQDDITLVPDRLILTLGTKLERNDYSGTEHQPNIRLLWTPDPTVTLWGAVGRAVRTPSRYDGDGVINFQVLPPASAANALPLPLLLVGPGGATRSETLVAHELGWKQRLAATLSADLAVFLNDYDNLRTSRAGVPLCQPSGVPVAAGCFLLPQQTYIVLNSPGGNEASGRSHGFELALDWRPMSALRLQLMLSQLHMKITAAPGSASTDLAGSAPKRQVGFHAAWNPRRDTDIDLWLRRVGELTAVTQIADTIPAYSELDLRFAWRPARDIELAVVGRNLLHARHSEFVSELGDVPFMQIERSLFGQINVKF